MMIGPIAHKLCEGRNVETNKQTLDGEFYKGFFRPCFFFFFALLVYYLSKGVTCLEYSCS